MSKTHESSVTPEEREMNRTSENTNYSYFKFPRWPYISSFLQGHALCNTGLLADLAGFSQMTGCEVAGSRSGQPWALGRWTREGMYLLSELGFPVGSGRWGSCSLDSEPLMFLGSSSPPGAARQVVSLLGSAAPRFVSCGSRQALHE